MSAALEVRTQSVIQAQIVEPPRKPVQGCPVSALRNRLREVGLRPTRQRMALGWLLFSKGDRHVCAEMLYDEARRAREPLSLATVYNTLRQFSDAGLLRQVPVAGPKTFFDTNTSEHHHFYDETTDTVRDIMDSGIAVSGLPQAPAGMKIASVEVIVRLRPIHEIDQQIAGEAEDER